MRLEISNVQLWGHPEIIIPLPQGFYFSNNFRPTTQLWDTTVFFLNLKNRTKTFTDKEFSYHRVLT